MKPIILDEKSKKILKQLRFNARIPLGTLAKKVGISKETANYRLKVMMEKTLSPRYFPELNLQKMRVTIFRVAFKLKTFDEQFENEMTKYLISLPTIWIGYVYGEWDIIFGIMVNSPLQFHNYLTKVMQKFGSHISEKAIGIQVQDFFLDYGCIYSCSRDVYKFREIYIDVNNKNNSNNNALFVMDDTDKQIITLLYNNARRSYLDISNRVSISPETVKKRIKRLQSKGIIKRYLTSIDRTPLGYRKYKVLLYVNNFSEKLKENILKYCLTVPNISHVTLTTGSWDLEIDYDAQSLTEFHTIFRKIRNKFSSDITDYTVLTTYHYKYVNPFG